MFVVFRNLFNQHVVHGGPLCKQHVSFRREALQPYGPSTMVLLKRRSLPLGFVEKEQLLERIKNEGVTPQLLLPSQQRKLHSPPPWATS